MLSLVWLALVFLLLVTAVGGFHVVREGLRTWRTLKGFSAFLGRASEAVGSRADAAAAKSAAAGETAVRLNEASERLSRSLAYAGVLAGAAGRTGVAARRVRRRMPRK